MEMLTPFRNMVWCRRGLAWWNLSSRCIPPFGPHVLMADQIRTKYTESGMFRSNPKQNALDVPRPAEQLVTRTIDHRLDTGVMSILEITEPKNQILSRCIIRPLEARSICANVVGRATLDLDGTELLPRSGSTIRVSISK